VLPEIRSLPTFGKTWSSAAHQVSKKLYPKRLGLAAFRDF
jgi:hypothetical protein